MTPRVVVIGGDAAGMSAASTIKRSLGEAVEVIVLEKGEVTSYAACGIPYWIAGEVDDRDALIMRSAEEHRKNGIDVRLNAEAVSIDTTEQTVRTRDGEQFTYDHLVIATGAEPIRPPIPGIDAVGIHEVHDLLDGEEVRAAIETGCNRAVIVGSGYIGLEMAEAAVARGLDVTVLERYGTPMSILAPEMGELVAESMRAAGVEFVGNAEVTGFRDDENRVRAVQTASGEYAADFVLLGLGVRARSKIAEDAGLRTGAGKAIVVDEFGKAPGHDNIWAAGDVAVSHHRVSNQEAYIALGTHANKQGLVVGRAITALLSGNEPAVTFRGVVGTAITRFDRTEIALSGLSEHQATAAGFDPVVAKIKTHTAADYYPDSEPMTIRLVADRSTRRLLGGQIVGGKGAGPRINSVALALWNEMTVDELAMTDLAYAPPFSPVWDPVQMASRAAIRALDAS